MNDRRNIGSDRRRPGADVAESGSPGPADPVGRLSVKKTWKLYVGGAFVRSESGRYLVTADEIDNYPRASRKDVRDAVKAAHAALRGWRGRTAYNRGQILYRLAEVMEARRSELIASLAQGGAQQSEVEVAASIDRLVSYAGWSDKYQSLLSSSNPVAGPHFGFSVPDAMGVVGLIAPLRPSLLGLIGALCPIVVSGNVTVALASPQDPRTALVLAECLATSDMPGGVVNLLTGRRAELMPHLALHRGVRAVDLWDVSAEDATSLEQSAVENVKRVSRRSLAEADWYDSDRGTSPTWIDRFVETKTVWHPMGA